MSDIVGDIPGGSKHHYLGNVEDVVAAGQIKIKGQGAIKRIDDLSGHYQPTLNQAITQLKTASVIDAIFF